MKCKIIFKLWCVITLYIIYLLWAKYNNDYKPIVIAQSTKSKLKYILIWTRPNQDPIKYLGEGNKTFVQRNCPNTNCYVSSNKYYFKNITEFDAIIFHSRSISEKDLPKLRSLHQKYVFASMESSSNYPLCDKKFNDYFNWTWTYKLNSEETYGYITIRNKDGTIIGPKEIMHWKKVEEMKPISDALKERLSTKKYAAAWFVSNCHSRSKREVVASRLKLELKKYGLLLDIYGRCGGKKCPKSNMIDCLNILEKDYFFYLSFENSFSEDYVTEKLLHALLHYAVPIVLGGANYSRFMPDGIYLDARKLTISHLAKQMADLINDKGKYYSYFKWHNHYSYHDIKDSPESDSYCKLCSLINDEKRSQTASVYTNFIQWWNIPKRCV